MAMEQHRKWWKIRSQECTTDFYDTEAAWKAALKWVLLWENNIEPRWREEYLPERDTLPVYDIIRKELKNDNKS